jgi:hypothetical protein
VLNALLGFICSATNGVVMDNLDVVGGYACPVDPMDALQCDSCQ